MVSKGALVEEAELSLPAAPRPWGTRVSAVQSILTFSSHVAPRVFSGTPFTLLA